MDHDDRDTPNSPLPPHERGWRHPAEIGEWSRTTHELVTGAPPLSRRLTALVAGLSVALSLVVVAIAIPREEKKETTTETSVTATGLRSQSIESAMLTELANVDTSNDAVNLTPGDVVYLHTPSSSPVRATVGLETMHRAGFYPLNVSQVIDELVLVTDENDRVIGVAKTIEHHTWFVSTKYIGALVTAELDE